MDAMTGEICTACQEPAAPCADDAHEVGMPEPAEGQIGRRRRTKQTAAGATESEKISLRGFLDQAAARKGRGRRQLLKAPQSLSALSVDVVNCASPCRRRLPVEIVSPANYRVSKVSFNFEVVEHPITPYGKFSVEYEDLAVDSDSQSGSDEDEVMNSLCDFGEAARIMEF